MKKWLHVILVFIAMMIVMFVLLYIPSAFLIGSCGVLSGYSRTFYFIIAMLLLIGYPLKVAKSVYNKYKK